MQAKGKGEEREVKAGSLDERRATAPLSVL
jgi:hypothetical protein